MIYPDSYEQKVGFDRIRTLLKEHCLSSQGMQKADEILFLSNYDTICREIELTWEMKTILMFEQSFPQDNYQHFPAVLQKITVEGTYIEAEEVNQIRKSLLAIRAITRFFKSNEANEKYPTLYEYAASVASFPEILKGIDRILDTNGGIKDNASTELNEIRSTLKSKQNSVHKKLQSILKLAKKQGIVNDDVEATIRDGRPVIPIPVSDKRRFGGLIHDESASGKTAFVEPAALVELNNEIRELKYAERREIINILILFANELRPYIEEILEAYKFLAEIDLIRAKAKLALKINGTKPIIENRRHLEWRNAIHPLLYLSHKAENKEVVPLNIRLDEKDRILLISGPNAGGKSVCLKTVGLIQYMLQCGLLIPLGENSICGLYDNIFIDIGDEQSLENDLSTYSGHLQHMKYFLRKANKSTLILIDEFGTGTEPVLGGAIAEAMLEEFNNLKCFGVITTHYANLKQFANGQPGLVNGAMLFDTQKIQPLYKLVMGRPGSSFAIDIARKIGVPEEILKSASEKIGEEKVISDKYLREIARDKKYWEEKRQRIRKVEKTLDGLYDKYGTELDQLEQERKNIIKEAKKVAQQIINDANARVERTIREIKESQAEKEKTRKLRQDLDAYQEKLQDEKSLDKGKLSSKKKEVEKAGYKLRKHSPELRPERKAEPASTKKRELQVGDLVKLVDVGSSGEILEIHGKKAIVAAGSMSLTISTDKLELLEGSEQKSKRSKVQISNSITSRKLDFKGSIDVRGKRGDEAISAIRDFIDDAIMASAKDGRILHGKGNGILRTLIRDYLKTVDVVKTFHDEHADRGGVGITIVEFDYD